MGQDLNPTCPRGLPGSISRMVGALTRELSVRIRALAFTIQLEEGETRKVTAGMLQEKNHVRLPGSSMALGNR